MFHTILVIIALLALALPTMIFALGTLAFKNIRVSFHSEAWFTTVFIFVGFVVAIVTLVESL